MKGVVVPAVKRVPNPRSVPQRPNTEEKLKVSWKLKLFVCVQRQEERDWSKIQEQTRKENEQNKKVKIEFVKSTEWSKSNFFQ